MEFYEIVLMGVALSMDAMAVTIANYSSFKEIDKKYELLIPLVFGIFQGVMPLLGYLFASVIKDYIINFIPYISASIFFILSAKIFIDKFKDIRREKTNKNQIVIKRNFTFFILIMQAIATSIDALITGFTLIDSKVNIIFSALIITLATFLICSLAILSGKKLGEIFGKYAFLFGGEILLILSIKSLLSAI